MRKKTIFLRLTIAALVMLLSKEVSQAELIGYWNLDEYNGTKVSDSSGKGHDGALIGGSSFTTNSAEGIIGRAISLDGKDDHIYVDSIHLPVSAFTIALWFNPTLDIGPSDKKMYLMYWGGPFARQGDKPFLAFNKSPRDGKVIFCLSFDEQDYRIHTRTNYWKGGQWHHLTVVFDGKCFKIYVNGILQNTDCHAGEHYASQSAYFGIRSNHKSAFFGKLDDIRIYDHALSENEIGQLGNISPDLQKLIIEAQKGVKAAEEKDILQAIGILKEKIKDCERWKKENPNHIGLYYETIFSDLYYELAKAKNKAGLPKEEVIDAYETAALISNKTGVCLVWLFENASNDEYTRIAKKLVKNKKPNYETISRVLASSGNYSAFKTFVDVVLDEAEQPAVAAKKIENGLAEYSDWKRNFFEYCKNKPRLTEYVFVNDYKVAQEYIAKDNFKAAVDIYRSIIEKCSNRQDKLGLEFKICQCLFSAGQYQDTLEQIRVFIEKHKDIGKELSQKAMLMRGECYIQLGQFEKALSEFHSTVSQNSHSQDAATFNFFIGYCHMLKGELNEAVYTLNLVTKNYPQSSYADKAHLYLAKINSEAERKNKSE